MLRALDDQPLCLLCDAPWRAWVLGAALGMLAIEGGGWVIHLFSLL